MVTALACASHNAATDLPGRFRLEVARILEAVTDEPLLGAPMTTVTTNSSASFRRLTVRRSQRVLVSLTVAAMLVVITTADHLSGPYLDFSMFYLIPVAVTAWYSSRTTAIAVGAFAATVGAIAIGTVPDALPPAILAANAASRVAIFVFSAFLINAERETRARVALLSTTDPLTGLLNRRAFMEIGTDRLRVAARRCEPVTLVYADLDDLKSRNDRFGHEAGDRMIIDYANTISAVLRSSDLSTRIGGDEFCLLLTATDEAGAVELLTRLESASERLETGPIRASLGAVSTVPGPDCDLSTLIGDADALMYAAKTAGRGRHRTVTR